jgi:hypothetical protein
MQGVHDKVLRTMRESAKSAHLSSMLNSGRNVPGGHTIRIIKSRDNIQGYKIPWRRDYAKEGTKR